MFCWTQRVRQPIHNSNPSQLRPCVVVCCEKSMCLSSLWTLGLIGFGLQLQTSQSQCFEPTEICAPLNDSLFVKFFYFKILMTKDPNQFSLIWFLFTGTNPNSASCRESHVPQVLWRSLWGDYPMLHNVLACKSHPTPEFYTCHISCQCQMALEHKGAWGATYRFNFLCGHPMCWRT